MVMIWHSLTDLNIKLNYCYEEQVNPPVFFMDYLGEE